MSSRYVTSFNLTPFKTDYIQSVQGRAPVHFISDFAAGFAVAKWFKEDIVKAQNNILSFEKFRLKKFLEVQGYQWFEDKNGKFRIWIRKSDALAKKTNGFFSPER